MLGLPSLQKKITVRHGQMVGSVVIVVIKEWGQTLIYLYCEAVRQAIVKKNLH